MEYILPCNKRIKNTKTNVYKTRTTVQECNKYILLVKRRFRFN